MFVPGPGAVDSTHDDQHHRDLNQHADHGRERRSRLKPEKADGGSDRELEEIGRSNQRRRAGNAVLLAGGAIEAIGEACIEKTWIRIGAASMAIKAGCSRIASPWKANSRTSVIRSAAMGRAQAWPS